MLSRVLVVDYDGVWLGTVSFDSGGSGE
jgi:hypothetical protein